MQTHLKVAFGLLFLGLSVGQGNSIQAGTFYTSNQAEQDTIEFTARAVQFLKRATFGPTEQEVNDLVDDMRQVGVDAAIEAWIDDQWTKPVSNHEQLALDMIDADDQVPNPGKPQDVHRYRNHAWWHIAVTGEDQLRQRVAWALSQIFVVARDGGRLDEGALQEGNGESRWRGLSTYYDMLVQRADDRYIQLLRDVTYHPVMGYYLTYVGNRAPSGDVFPDENYAREILQLFSIGLWELNRNGAFRLDGGELIPTYDNDDIKEYARLFTGLGYTGPGFGINTNIVNFTEPMTMYDAHHDFGDKTLFRNGIGNTFNSSGYTSGTTEINKALSRLSQHANVPPFISRLLIQRLVRSNPSTDYIERVEAAFRMAPRGSFRNVIKAILMDPEAKESIQIQRYGNRIEVTTGGSERNRLVEPVIAYAGLLRRFGTSDYPHGDGDNQYFMLPSEEQLLQNPYESPSVFNFYLPDFAPNGPVADAVPSGSIPNNDLFAPEFQLLSSDATNRLTNLLVGGAYLSHQDFRVIGNASPLPENEQVFRINFDFSEFQGIAGNMEQLVDRLDLMLCAGAMSDDLKQDLREVIPSESGNTLQRARGALMTVFTSPDFLIVE